MTEEEFASALDRWGGTLAMWPPAERQAGQALLAESQAAWREWQAMAAIESGLARTTLRGQGAGLAARVSAQRQERPVARLRLGWAVAACAVMAGFLHGALSSDTAGPRVDEWFNAALSNVADPFDVE